MTNSSPKQAAERAPDGAAAADPRPVPGLPTVRPGAGVDLATLTSLRLGGPAERVVVAHDEDQLVAAVAAADAAERPLLLLGGGSNLVIGDGPVAGDVVAIRTSGSADADGPADAEAPDGRIVRTVAAGEPWDAVVAASVADGLAGIECLSGIPGAAGATPIQNVGAYGQEVSDTIVSVRVLDRRTGEIAAWPAAACGFAYRDSVFKGNHDHVVLAVSFALERSSQGRPLRFGELARKLGVSADGRAPAAAVREAVLELRRGKGMVLDPDDPDTWSAGSFFTNPLLEPEAFAALRARVLAHVGPDAGLPAWDAPGGRLKTSAAWLIERAGFARGYARPGAAISSKHTLALTSRGGSTADLLALAHEVADGVERVFGVALRPEPVLLGTGDPRW